MDNIKIDEKTFADFLQGDSKAFGIIFHELSPKIYKRIHFLVKDEEEALEILQNVFLKLWDRRAVLNISYSTFVPYVYKMASSMCIDTLRRNVRKQNILNVLMRQGGEESSAEDIYVGRELDEILRIAIEKLPPQRKLIFNLCRMEGKSYEEVSEMLQISTSTVSNQLVSATKSIRNFVISYHDEVRIMILLSFLKNF